MQQPGGPGSPFVCLFDDQGHVGLDLPPAFQSIYGRWLLPASTGRPYTYVNFVTSRDGRVSFNEPGKRSGGPISGYSPHDRWLMGLLRARADAVLLVRARSTSPRATPGLPRQSSPTMQWLGRTYGRPKGGNPSRCM